MTSSQWSVLIKLQANTARLEHKLAYMQSIKEKITNLFLRKCANKNSLGH